MALLRLTLIIASASSILTSKALGFTPINYHLFVRSIFTRQANSLEENEVMSYIEADSVDEVPLDENVGGVGLANRCAIKISGTAKKGSECEADIFENMVRYEKLQEVDESEMKAIMDRRGCKLVCRGMGKELYFFPDSSKRFEDKVMELSPVEAAKEALASLKVSVHDAKSISINFLGGDDLIFGEVKQACDLLVEILDLPDKAKIAFHSVSYSSFEGDTCSVTVVANEIESCSSVGFEESIANGEVYFYNGKWFTVMKEDITLAIE